MATTSPQPSDSEPSSKKVKFSDDTELQQKAKDGDSVTATDLKTSPNNGVKSDSTQPTATTNNNNTISSNNNNTNNRVKSVVNVDSDADEDEESSQELDVDPKIRKCLEEVEAIQNDIESLNEQASEEILKVEQKYNKLRKPHFDKRNELLESVPNFWIGTFINTPSIASILDEEDEECLHYLTKVDVEEFEDIKSGFRIKFHFAPNPYFTNDVLIKEFHSGDASDEPTSKSTPINFKTDFEPAQRLKATCEQGLLGDNNAPGRKRHHDSVPRTFFSWFLQQNDASNDDIAEIIKEELYPNPLQHYLMSDPHGDLNSDDDDDDEDEDDDGADDDFDAVVIEDGEGDDLDDGEDDDDDDDDDGDDDVDNEDVDDEE